MAGVRRGGRRDGDPGLERSRIHAARRLPEGALGPNGDTYVESRRHSHRHHIHPVAALMDKRLVALTLGVSDLARARRFYEEGLGERMPRIMTSSSVAAKDFGLHTLEVGFDEAVEQRSTTVVKASS